MWGQPAVFQELVHLHIFSFFTDVCCLPCLLLIPSSPRQGSVGSRLILGWGGWLKRWWELVSVCVGRKRKDAWSPRMHYWATHPVHFTEESPELSLWFFILRGSESLLPEGLSFKLREPGIYIPLHFHFLIFYLGIIPQGAWLFYSKDLVFYLHQRINL